MWILCGLSWDFCVRVRSFLDISPLLLACVPVSVLRSETHHMEPDLSVMQRHTYMENDVYVRVQRSLETLTGFIESGPGH